MFEHSLCTPFVTTSLVQIQMTLAMQLTRQRAWIGRSHL